MDKLQALYDAEQAKWRAMMRNGGWGHEEYVSLRDPMDELDLEMTRLEMEERGE